MPALRKPGCPAAPSHPPRSICTARPCLQLCAPNRPLSLARHSPFLSLSHHVISLILLTSTMEGTSAWLPSQCLFVLRRSQRRCVSQNLTLPHAESQRCVALPYQPGQARVGVSLSLPVRVTGTRIWVTFRERLRSSRPGRLQLSESWGSHNVNIKANCRFCRVTALKTPRP